MSTCVIFSESMINNKKQKKPLFFFEICRRKKFGLDAWREKIGAWCQRENFISGKRWVIYCVCRDMHFCFLFTELQSQWLFIQFGVIVETLCEVIVIYALWSHNIIYFSLGATSIPIIVCHSGELVIHSDKWEYTGGNAGIVLVNVSRLSKKNMW